MMKAASKAGKEGKVNNSVHDKTQYLVDKKTNVVRIDLGKQQDTTYEPKILLPTQFPDQLATNPDKVMLSK